MNKLIKIILIFSVIFFILGKNNIYAQSFLTNTDFTKIEVEKLTDEEIQKLKSEMEKKHTSIDVLENVAISKGMTPANFSLLKTRLENVSLPISNVENGSKIENIPVHLDVKSQSNPVEFHSKIFGSELFTNPSLSFEPNPNMPTPLNYTLGTGDELQIVIYGIQEFSSNSTVSKEGKISIPNIGQLNVNGLTFEAATTLIKNACGKVFSTLKSGQSNISINLTKIRTIKVTIIGGKKSGNYSVSSLSTVFNALFLAGGPDDNGSYRNIELIRNNKTIKTIDVYKFLLYGDQADNIGLKDNDIIRIPVYTCRVSIEGQIKRNGIFELLPNENFNDLLKYCSGFSESAYTSTIKLIQNTEKELKIIDLPKTEYNAYLPRSGDIFKVGTILNRFENKISVKGAVFRPDDYSYYKGMRVSNLISKADGVTEDAYKYKAQILRLKDDFTKEIISINLEDAILGDSANNIELKKDDELLVFSVFDFNNVLSVQIDGKVRKPGTYPYVTNLTLFDVILQSGSFTDDASKRIEIARMIKKDEAMDHKAETATIFVIEINSLSEDLAKNMLLEPGDIIQVRKKPFYNIQKNVNINGSVQYPGDYTISNQVEKILDFINRAGGLKIDANPMGIYVKREDYIIPINYIKIIKRPSSSQNIKLQPGDQIVVQTYIPAIKVNGGAVLNTEIPYEANKNLKYFINSAGGVKENGWKAKIYVQYPNGTAKNTKNFLIFRKYPNILPGSVIFIPTKPAKEKRDIREVLAMSSITTSMISMVAVVTNLLKK